MKIVLWFAFMILGGGALAAWLEVFGVAGNPDGGGAGVAVLATVLTVAAAGVLLLESRLSRR